MTYEEKFETVVRAIKEAKKLTPTGYDTKLKITYENKLQDLDLDDISSILFQIQNDHKVIKMISTANAKFLLGLDPWSEEQDYYALEVLSNFEKWSENYLDKKPDSNRAKITEIKSTKYTRKAVEKIWNVLQEIEELKQINAESSKIKMLYIPPGFEERHFVPLTGYTHVQDLLNRVIEQRGAILKKLDNEDVIMNLHSAKANGIHGFWTFETGTEYEKFFNEQELIYSYLAEEYESNKKATQQKKNPPSTSSANKAVKYTYWITYRDDRQIVLNDVFKLGKPQLNGDNDLLFKYLYENANKVHIFEELKGKAKLKGNKDLHKFVNNIGFKNDLKKIFFEVSKDSILFRNPVTSRILQDLEIDKVKL